jgi:hypothetical protein
MGASMLNRKWATLLRLVVREVGATVCRHETSLDIFARRLSGCENEDRT